MVGAFSFNGVEAESFKLVCKSVKRPLLPSAKPKRVELPGASGAYDFEGREYEIRQITMRIVYLGTSFQELRTRARSIAAWLGVPDWSRLIINDEPDKYYLAKITSELDLQSIFEAGVAEISFDCQPFAYSVDMENVGVGAFINPGTRHIDFRSPPGSHFLITATVSASASFTMNDRTLTYSGNAGNLVIDNISMEAKMNNQNVFGKLSGDIDLFFQILPGQNTLSAVGASNVNAQYIPMWY